MLEEMETKKIHEVTSESPTTINLCSQEPDVAEGMELVINYSYKDSIR